MLCILQSLKPVNHVIFYNIRFTLTSEEVVAEEVCHRVFGLYWLFSNGCIIIIIVSSVAAILFAILVTSVCCCFFSFGLLCGLLFSSEFGSPGGVAGGVVVFEFIHIVCQGGEVAL